jgi:hypothetical protein
MCGTSDRIAVLEERLNDVHEEESYESSSMRVMWTAAGDVQSLGLAFHLSTQRPLFSSDIARYMYRDETAGQSWPTTFTYGRVGNSRKLTSPGKFTDVK